MTVFSGELTQKRSAAEGRPFFVTNRKGLSLFVAAVEFVNTTGGIDEFLLAGEERMAFGADSNLGFGTGGFDVPNFTAGAGDDGIFVLRMNIFFHLSSTPFIYYCYTKILNQTIIYHLFEFFQVQSTVKIELKVQIYLKNGAPDAVRTHDLLLRRELLYPTELRKHREKLIRLF